MDQQYTQDQRDAFWAEDEHFRIVLCGASKYDQKYYFNHKFDSLPENIKEELQIICVLFTEEVGGIMTIGYTPTGEVVIDTRADEGDLLYDEIGSALLVKKIRSTKQDMFRSLSVYYKAKFLKMDLGRLLEEEEDEDTDAEGNADLEGGEDAGAPRDTFHRDSTPEDLADGI